MKNSKQPNTNDRDGHIDRVSQAQSTTQYYTDVYDYTTVYSVLFELVASV